MLRIIFFFFLILSQTSFANELEGTYLPDPNYLTYNTIDGLSNSIVTAIVQDSNGIMWFGTEEGLNRFDGNKFITYRRTENNKNSLSGIRITKLHIDKFNNLWIGTASNGLNLYRNETDDFINFKIKNSNLNSNSITALTSDEDYVWVGTDTGLNKISLKTQKIEQTKLPNKNDNSNSTIAVSALFKTKLNILWVGTNSGLIKLNYLNGNSTTFNEKNSKLSSNNITDLYIDRYEELWVATEYGLNKFDSNCKCFNSYLSSAKNETSIPNNFVIAITESKQGELWIGTNRGVAIYNRDTNNFSRFRLLKEHEMGNETRDIRSAYTSTDGTIWLGSFQMDLISIPITAFNFQTYHYSIYSSGLKSDDINSVYAQESFMLTGAVAGLFKYDFDKKGKITKTTKLLNDFALSIEKAKDNSYWFATNRGVIHLSENFELITFYRQNDINNGISQGAVLDVIEAHNGDIYAAIWGSGFNKLAKNEKNFINIKQDFNGNELQSTQLVTLLEDSKNQIWIGSDKGLDKYNPITKQIVNYDLLLDQNDTKTYVNHITEGYSGLWVGTNVGLFLYNNKSDSFKKVNLTLDSDYILGIIEHNRTNLWITTFNGLYKLDLNNNKIEKYKKSDGIQGSEFNTKGVFNYQNKRLYFSGIDGVTTIKTSDLINDNFDPQVYFSTLKHTNENTSKSLVGINNVPLEYNQNNFTLNYYSDSYSSPKKLKYRYRINLGGWRHLNTQNQIQFINQAHGELIIEVQASLNEDEWSQKSAIIKITITAPFWKTIQAYLFYIFIIISMLFISYKIRTSRIKQYQKQLEEKVSERTSEVKSLLIQKENLFANISHELRTPLTLISAPLDQLLNHNNLTSKQEKLLKMANNNSKRLFKLVEKILNLTSTNKKEKSLENIVIDDQIVKYIIAFEPLLQAKKIKLSKSLTSNAVLKADQDDIASIIENLLTNALKYTLCNGWVKLKSSVDNGLYQLIIENSHNGLTNVETDKVFDRFERLGQSDSEQGFGLGLSFVKDICQENNWQIECNSTANHSISFILTINDFSILEEQTITPAQRQINELELNKGSQAKTHKQSILIVEDNTELREFLADIFSGEYSVKTAKNGLLGVDTAIDEIPDIIISDVMMPELDGYQLVEQLSRHDNTCHIPIILLTAKADKESELKGLELGSIDYITKPFDANSLLSKVRNTLNKKQSLLNTSKTSDIKNNVQYLSERDKNFNEKLNRIVKENYIDNNFAVEQLVDKIAMSERQLQRKLKAVFNQTPAEFIRYYRLLKSKELLLAGKSISNVADLVGFNSSSYFSRSFKSTFEQSPSEFIQDQNSE